MYNTVYIMYYENMIDLISENQKINELLMAPKFIKYFTESAEEISLCENKVIDAVISFFKKILDKVSQFFKKLLDIISDKKNFTANKKLISLVEEKIKASTSEEKDSYKDFLEINIIGNTPYLDYLLEFSEEAINKLENIVYDLKDILYQDVESHWIKKEIEKFDLKIEIPTKTQLVIGYNDLKEIISQYENMFSRVKTIRTRLQADQITMNNYKKTIDKIARKNSEEIHSEVLSKYKEVTVLLCELIMKANAEIIKEMMYSFRSYEKLMKALVTEEE